MIQAIVGLASTTYMANNNTPSFNTQGLSELLIDINVTSVRGVTPSMAWFLDRQGADGLWYPCYSPTALTAAGVISTTLGPGQATNQGFSNRARLRWTVAGTATNTTVSTGANSATQALTSTAGMLAGDTLQFVTAATSRTILTVTDSTHVVLDSAVNSTTSEVVNVTNTPAMTFSASIQGQ